MRNLVFRKILTSPWRNMKNNISYVVVIILILYIAYFASEICMRIQNLQKYERLKTYETEIDDLTSRLVTFRQDSSNVKRSLGILKEVLSDLVKLYNNSNTQISTNNNIRPIPKSQFKRRDRPKSRLRRNSNVGSHLNRGRR